MFYSIPDVHAADRDIPKGKTLVAECGQITADDPRAIPVLLEEKGEHRLEAIPAGWATAGSMMRWDNGAFRVSFDFDGALHGRRFRDYDEARTFFDRWAEEG